MAHCIRLDSVARGGIGVQLVAQLQGNGSLFQHLITFMMIAIVKHTSRSVVEIKFFNPKD